MIASLTDSHVVQPFNYDWVKSFSFGYLCARSEIYDYEEIYIGFKSSGEYPSSS
ncbi:MAG: hypothetical protein LBH90_05995 [Tannerella sp.]|jgi:hypothetical protein|nr:hypothetical protein [Tannerella sp.]